MTDDLNYVTIADEEWELAPADSAVSVVGDAMFQASNLDAYTEVQKLEKAHRRKLALLRKQGIAEEHLPDPPARLVDLIIKLQADSFRAALSCLNLAPPDAEFDDERPTQDDFTEAVGAWYRERNGGPMTDADLNEVTTAITDAFAARAEAATAVPPSRPAGSPAGPSRGKAGPASKPSQARSKTSRSRALSS